MKSKATFPTLPASAKYASAVSASLAASFESNAAIVYSGIQDITVTVTSSSTAQTATIDIDGNGGSDFRFVANFSTSSTSSPTSRFSVRGSLLVGSFAGGLNRPLNSTGLLTPFLPGNQIGATEFMAPTIGNNGAAVRGFAGTSGGASTSSVQGLVPPGAPPSIIPIQFQRNGNTHYGWLRLSLDEYLNEPGTSIVSGTVVDWAYESTPDTPISAGAVPEPSSLALLALGATGLGAVRRRKKV